MIREKRRQEDEGIIEKPVNTGRFKYKMRKTDFQMENELAGSLRQLKAQGQDDLLRDRFDSVFRRNLVEMDAPTNDEKKRQRKMKYKFKDRHGGVYGSLTAKLDKKNKKLKAKNDAREKKQGFLNDDLILI